MKFYSAMLFREYKIASKHYFWSFICYFPLAAFFIIPLIAMECDYSDIAMWTSISVLFAALFAGANNGNNRSDIKSGWKRYSYILPISPVQWAISDLLVKVRGILRFVIMIIAINVMVPRIFLKMFVIQPLLIFFFATAIVIFIETICRMIVMSVNNKKDLIKRSILSTAVSVLMFFLIVKGILMTEIMNDDYRSAVEYLGSGKFICLSLTMLIFSLGMYFLIMMQTHKKREP